MSIDTEKTKTNTNTTLTEEGKSEKEIVEELKVQWRSLWRERVDDKQRAEGISTNDYTKLFVDKGTIIHATRDFKSLNFREILESHKIIKTDKYIQPDKNIGGWSKFIKSNITRQPVGKHRRAAEYKSLSRRDEKHTKKQPKKGGRGWLHLSSKQV